MSGSVNKVILLGNLARDPEVRSTQDGREIANMTIATSESWKDKQSGERKEKSEFHRVVIFSEGLVNIAKNYLKKGTKVYLEGALQTRKWTDKDGQEKYSTEVVLQGFGATLTILSSSENREKSEPKASESSRSHAPAELLDEEIPFAWLLAIGTSAAAFASQLLPAVSA